MPRRRMPSSEKWENPWAAPEKRIARKTDKQIRKESEALVELIKLFFIVICFPFWFPVWLIIKLIKRNR